MDVDFNLLIPKLVTQGNYHVTRYLTTKEENRL